MIHIHKIIRKGVLILLEVKENEYLNYAWSCLMYSENAHFKELYYRIKAEPIQDAKQRDNIHRRARYEKEKAKRFFALAQSFLKYCTPAWQAKSRSQQYVIYNYKNTEICMPIEELGEYKNLPLIELPLHAGLGTSNEKDLVSMQTISHVKKTML